MGRPLGAQNKDKPWAEALRRVVFTEGPEGRRRLLTIAETCVASAEAGDMAAIKEIGDRLDGKPAQEASVTVTHARAAEMSDDELASIAAGSGNGADPAPVDPAKFH